MTMMRSTVSILVSTVLCILVFVFGIVPAEEAIAKRETRIALLHEEILKLKQRQKNLQALENEVQLPDDTIVKAKNRQDALLSIQRHILGVVDGFPITVRSFGASRLERKLNHDTVVFDLEVVAPLDQILNFFEALEKHDTAVAIASIKIRPTNLLEEKEVSVQIAAWAFWSPDT